VTVDRPVDLVRRLHLELWGDGDITAIERFIAPDATTSMTGFEGSTVDVVREDVERYLGAFTDIATEIVELVDGGDSVVLWWRTAGTHTGPYGDIAPTPTGLRITMEGVDIYRVSDGLVVEVRSFWEAADVYRQFGLLADGL
jgi:predicted ester cyclase